MEALTLVTAVSLYLVAVVNFIGARALEDNIEFSLACGALISAVTVLDGPTTGIVSHISNLVRAICGWIEKVARLLNEASERSSIIFSSLINFLGSLKPLLLVPEEDGHGLCNTG